MAAAMTIGRIIGWFLVAAAVGAAGYEGFSWLQSGAYRGFTFGETWAAIDRGSLNLLQAGIQRYVAPWLWEDVVLPVLLAPLWLVLAVPGAALAWLFRRGATSRRRRRGARLSRRRS